MDGIKASVAAPRPAQSQEPKRAPVEAKPREATPAKEVSEPAKPSEDKRALAEA